MSTEKTSIGRRAALKLPLLGAAAATGLARTASGQPVGGRAAARTLRFVPYSNLIVMDPVWAISIIGLVHAYMTCDQLYGLDDGFVPRPQMAAGHDPTHWLTGWYPATQRMQIDSHEKQGVRREDWWHAGTAPFLELIPESDPFKPPAQWGEMRAAFGDRVTTVIIRDASHALFPEQPEAVAAAILLWMRRLA